MNNLTFRELRMKNLARLPLFKNSKGQIAHPSGDVDHWEPSQWLQALVGEVGEYANIRKKYERGDIGLGEFLREARKELADIQIYLDLLAARLHIDLGAATADKWDEVSERIGCNLRINDGSDDALTPERVQDAVREVKYRIGSVGTISETLLVALGEKYAP